MIVCCYGPTSRSRRRSTCSRRASCCAATCHSARSTMNAAVSADPRHNNWHIRQEIASGGAGRAKRRHVTCDGAPQQTWPCSSAGDANRIRWRYFEAGPPSRPAPPGSHEFRTAPRPLRRAPKPRRPLPTAALLRRWKLHLCPPPHCAVAAAALQPADIDVCALCKTGLTSPSNEAVFLLNPDGAAAQHLRFWRAILGVQSGTV